MGDELCPEAPEGKNERGTPGENARTAEPTGAEELTRGDEEGEKDRPRWERKAGETVPKEFLSGVEATGAETEEKLLGWA